MSVSRLAHMAGIGVDRMGETADRLADPEVLRLENLDTDLRPPPGVEEATCRAVGRDAANSYLPFLGADRLREAAAARVSAAAGVDYDWRRTTVISAGGLNGILNVLLALLEPGDQVVLPDPIYIGLVNRVRLAGGEPVFLRFEVRDGSWVLDPDSVARAVGPRTRAFLMMSPAMPSGAVLAARDWEVVCRAVSDTDAWMIHDAAMERIVFDGLEPVHPARFPHMAERTITVGSVSKEYRMIGWRVGWIVAPPRVVDDIGLVNISNVVSNVGLAQEAAAVALTSDPRDLERAVATWQERRDVVLDELDGWPVIRPRGGWSMLVDVAALGLTPSRASALLLERGKVAATPMLGWGGGDPRYVRLVYSNEPVDRLRGLGGRVAEAWS